MNVLHLVITLSRGGRREAILRLVGDLERQGVQCHVACVKELGCSTEEAASFGRPVEVLKRQGPFDVRALMRLARLCRDRHIDVIHAHGPTSQLGAAALRLARPHLKVLMTFHRSLGIDTVGFRNCLRNSLSGFLTDAVITASTERQGHFRRTTFINPDKVVRIPFGIDAGRFSPDPDDRAAQRRSLGLGPEVTLLGAVGHFGHEKGLDVVIRAYHELARRHPPGSLALLVLGEGSPAQEKALRELASAGPGKINLGGFRQDTDRCFRAMDVFVHAPRLEAFGLVLIEAMSSGLPVVATRVGGIPDIVREGQTGLLVPPDDPVRLAGAVDEMLAIEGRCAAFGAKAREVVLQEYSGEVGAQRHLKLYREILAGQRPEGVDPRADLSDPPRVVHVVESLEVGGLERLVADLVRLRGSQKTSVACLEQVGAFGDDLRSHGVDVRLIGMEKGPVSTLVEMCAYLRELRPDIVHCHNMTAQFFGGLGARLIGSIPLVTTKHGNAPPDAGKRGWPNRWLARRGQVIAVSKEVHGLMSRWVKGRGRPVLYVPNGISLAPFHDLRDRGAARAHLQWPAGEFVIGIVARLAPTKGHDCLVQAFARFRKEIPAARLIIVGDGKMRPAIPEIARGLGLESSVCLLGERPDVPVILAALDLFALPSEHEGMPVTVLEAMAAGLPVVASAVGGIPQVVEDGQTGILVPPRDPEALAQAMLVLARDPARRQRMGELGKQRVHQQFAMGQMAASYEDVYRKLLAEKWPPANTVAP